MYASLNMGLPSGVGSNREGAPQKTFFRLDLGRVGAYRLRQQLELSPVVDVEQNRCV